MAQTQKSNTQKNCVGVFHYHELPGQNISFFYDAEGIDGEFCLEDGKEYTLPKAVADHLNNSGWYPIRKIGKDGKLEENSEKYHRYTFQVNDIVEK